MQIFIQLLWYEVSGDAVRFWRDTTKGYLMVLKTFLGCVFGVVAYLI